MLTIEQCGPRVALLGWASRELAARAAVVFADY